MTKADDIRPRWARWKLILISLPNHSSDVDMKNLPSRLILSAGSRTSCMHMHTAMQTRGTDTIAAQHQPASSHLPIVDSPHNLQLAWSNPVVLPDISEVYRREIGSDSSLLHVVLLMYFLLLVTRKYLETIVSLIITSFWKAYIHRMRKAWSGMMEP